ncbi:MAG: TIGR01459 family HAD-type hydrolase [Pseudomonadota bacterium]
MRFHGPDALTSFTEPFPVVIFDQWGVLHNGAEPYPGAIGAIEELHRAGKRLAVLSNSGKRAESNRARIASFGFPADRFETVMTSGEAFYRDVETGAVQLGRVFVIDAKRGDFEAWSVGLNVERTEELSQAAQLIVMGLPEGSDGSEHAHTMSQALDRGLPLYCTNPDRQSPRAGASFQISPGSLAHQYGEKGGKVVFYGKPHAPIFHALCRELSVEPAQCLMVGDSFEHDIAGAHGIGMAAAFVMGGLHAADFRQMDDVATLVNKLAGSVGSQMPDYLVNRLSEVQG